MAKLKTPLAGANATRTALLAFLRRQKKKRCLPPTRRFIDDLLVWVLKMNERFDVKKGGLGK